MDRQDREIPCDKQVITECVRQWFGSVDAFKDDVRSGVAAALSEGLGDLVFPYLCVLAAAAPILWGQGDFIASRLREGEFYDAGVTAVIGLAYWFAAIPFIFSCGGLIVYKFHHRCTASRGTSRTPRSLRSTLDHKLQQSVKERPKTIV